VAVAEIKPHNRLGQALQEARMYRNTLQAHGRLRWRLMSRNTPGTSGREIIAVPGRSYQLLLTWSMPLDGAVTYRFMWRGRSRGQQARSWTALTADSHPDLSERDSRAVEDGLRQRGYIDEILPSLYTVASGMSASRVQTAAPRATPTAPEPQSPGRGWGDPALPGSTPETGIPGSPPGFPMPPPRAPSVPQPPAHH